MLNVSVPDDLVNEARHVIGVLEGMRGLSLTNQVSCILGGAIERLQDQIDGNCPELDEEEKALIEQNSAIPAIKHYRKRTGHDLRTSKGVVDDYREEIRRKNPQLWYFNQLQNRARYYMGLSVGGAMHGMDNMDGWDEKVNGWLEQEYLTPDAHRELSELIQRVRNCDAEPCR